MEHQGTKTPSRIQLGAVDWILIILVIIALAAAAGLWSLNPEHHRLLQERFSDTGRAFMELIS